MAAIAQNFGMAGVSVCKAIKSKGDQCSTKSVAHGYCRVHMNCRKTHGPLEYGLMQLEYRKKADMAKLKELRGERIDKARELPFELQHDAFVNAHRSYDGDVIILKAKYVGEERALRQAFATGPEEDKEVQRIADDVKKRIADEKRARYERELAEAREARAREHRERIDRLMAIGVEEEERVAALNANPMIMGALNAALGAAGGQGRQGVMDAVINQAFFGRLAELGGQAPIHEWAGAEGIAFAPPAPVERGIGDIARDNQSIHTTEVVRHTKEIVEKVRTIPVPEGYRWDKEICSKTPGEIIAECRLTQKAAHQMMSQYAQDTAIYDIEEGIYGKVLDSVWQFVKGHAEKESLTAIIRDEMQGNIGMCAQGNLTRICNVLSGYLDGVGVAESLSEKLGRLLPPLREIEDSAERRTAVMFILKQNDVPADQWDTWIEAVMD